MNPSSWGTIIFEFVLLIVFSAFFSGMESALLSVSRIKLESMAQKNSVIAKKILELKKNPEKFISPIVLGNNFVNILASVLATYFSVMLAKTHNLSTSASLAITTVLLTVVIVIFGEMIPKSIAAYDPEKYAFSFFYIFKFFWLILFPFAWILSLISRGFLYLFGIKKEKTVFENSEELMTMLHMGKEEGLLEKSEEKMIFSIFEFGDTLVREVMTPRVDMVTIPVNATFDEVLNTIINSNHSRIPVYHRKVDNILGILYIKDLFKFFKSRGDKNKEINLRDILRPAYFVPETKRVDELFREMQKKKIQIAMVFDEYGGISGLVTMEDLLEEIVGEIQDEYEVDEKTFQKIGNDAYLVSGMMSIDDFNEELNVNLSDEEADTIGGIILEKLGRLPKPGEEVEVGKIKFIVNKIRGRRIVQVKVIVKDDKEAK